MEDVQGLPDTRRLAIDQVGIKGLHYPISVSDRTRSPQHTVAIINMYVNLPHDQKGTHMSRFLEILERHDRDISAVSFGAMLENVARYLNAAASRIEMAFPYFINKSAPVSRAQSLMDYAAMIFGQYVNGETDVWLKVSVPVTSLCPCSKQIADYGAHNQRSRITITAKIGARIWFEELIDIAENEASCALFGILKRADEKYVTEHAYDNPKFVEDVVRDVAAALNKESRVRSYIIESENFESIHNHSAYASIAFDKEK